MRADAPIIRLARTAGAEASSSDHAMPQCEHRAGREVRQVPAVGSAGSETREVTWYPQREPMAKLPAVSAVLPWSREGHHVTSHANPQIRCS